MEVKERISKIINLIIASSRFTNDYKRLDRSLVVTVFLCLFMFFRKSNLRYLPVKLSGKNIELLIMYDAEKLPILETQQAHKIIPFHP